MVRRLFYHGFWNLYDHIGTLILAGILHSLMSLGIVIVAMGMMSLFASTVPVLVVAVILEFILLVIFLSALLPYCARCARGEPARFPHLISGFKQKWPSVAKILAIVALIAAVLLVNLMFYLPLQRRVESQTMQMIIIVVTAIIGWAAVAFYMFIAPWLCAATASTELTTVGDAFRKGLMAVALFPISWIGLAAVMIFLAVIGAYTRVGIIFLLPVFTSFGHTAYQLAAQHADFLAKAKDEIGAGKSLKHYKRRAVDLGWEWEQRQPRRTFKELIRPWEY